MRLLQWVVLVLFFVSTLHASVFKGQREYMRKCKKCHGNGAKFVGKYSSEEWKNYFKDDAVKIKAIHQKTDAKEYFNSHRFDKKARHLLDFFKKYASDSGNVPACSD